MFTGFASENTPAIQVWDFFRTFASTSAVRSVSLPDDCAPIQIFRTGATTTAITVYLPTAPIEGKQITIVNQCYGSSSQTVSIYSSDVSGSGTNTTLPIVTLGQGDSIVLVYSKQCISFGTSSGYLQTGWLSLNKGFAGAVNHYSAVVGGSNNEASKSYAFIGGGTNNTASGQYSVVVGGNGSGASSSNAFVGGGSSNFAGGTSSAVLGGDNNNASGVGSQNVIFGGNGNTADAVRSAILSGQTNNVSSGSTYGIVLGGNANTSSSTAGTVINGSHGTTRSITGNIVSPASFQPIAASSGITQSALLVLAVQTTNATATVLRSNSSAATTTNQVILPNNSAYTFQGTCIANVTGGSTTSGWEFQGVIKRGANAASTTLVAAVTPTVIAQDVAAATWVLAITADVTNGGIAVTVTGAAATTIRWVSRIETTEVTF